MDYLEITDNQGRHRRIALDQPRLLIGREHTCDIFLPHPNVSRRHAQLQQTEQGRWMLQDLNSLNHVYVDNRPVKQIILEPGRPVRIAEYQLRLSDGGTEPERERDSSTQPAVGPDEAWTGLEPGWLEQLQLFQRTLLRQEEPCQVLERLAQEFNRIAHPQMVAVGLVEPDGYRWEVVLSDQPENGADDHSLEEAGRRASEEDSDLQSWIAESSAGRGAAKAPEGAPLCMLFPIKGRSSILGHVLIQSPRCPLSPAVQRYLTLLINHAGLVWDNCHLAALRLAQKEFEQELRQARQIQVDLFPPTFDVDARLNAFAVNLPSVQVSGDYYDLFRTGPDTVAFVIADAMGHGMPAALLMAAVRAALRMGVSLGLPWQDVFRGLDGLIVQARTGGSFVTGLIGQVNLARNELQLVVAGHLPPSILVNGRAVPVPEGCQTRPWGLNFECPWEVGRMELGTGPWSILCYTDGITDAAARFDRGNSSRVVADYHQRSGGLNAEDLCLGLLNEVSARLSAGPLGDDQTVLVLRSAGS
jgi:serine phosphatase RsbU (regulator of sigma subunit)